LRVAVAKGEDIHEDAAMATEAVDKNAAKTLKIVGFMQEGRTKRGSRGSIRCGEDVKRGAVTVRKSVAVPAMAVVGKSIQELRKECAEVGDDEDAPYLEVIDEARECLGGRNAFKEFHEEWDAQLLIRCADTFGGERVVLFCPFFLRPVLNDHDEMDRAFRFIMLSMDEIAMNKKYIFVYCYLGMDWTNPSLASRLRFAYDILPRKYGINLKAFYVLHPTRGFKVTMWTFRPLISKGFWDRIEYVSTLDEICELIHPDDETKREDLKRRFPLAVHRQDAEILQETKPVTFGVPLKQMCLCYGVDFVDKTTGKMYPRLPPAVIFLCEALEREAAEEDFTVFDAHSEDIYRLVDIIDEGRPLERDTPPTSLWCVLKLWVDCLPSPLFSFQAMEELHKKKVKAGDMEAQRKFLIDLFHNHLSTESAYVALYLSSFLHTMCRSAIERHDGEQGAKKTPIIPSTAAQVFTPGFIRPRTMTDEMHGVVPDAISLLETLITCAEEPELWIGRREPVQTWGAEDKDSDSSDDDNVSPASGAAAGDQIGAASSGVASASAIESAQVA